MAGFVQIVQFTTSNFEEMQKLADQWRDATEGKRSTSRVTTTRDRDNPNQYFIIAEFASYEDAMRNNDLPETQQFSGEMQKLADGQPTFHNLDVERVEED